MPESEAESRQRALLGLAREVTARHDLDDVLAATFRELRAIVSFGGGSIQLIDEDGWITVAAADPPVAVDAGHSRVPLGNSVAGRVVLTERAVYLADVDADARAMLLPTADCGDHVKCYLAVPLLADGRAIGLLRVDADTPDAFSETERETLVTAGVIVAAAIQNARAHARSAASKARADAVEQRLAAARAMVAEALASPTRTDVEISGLLTGLERALQTSQASATTAMEGSRRRATN